MIHQLESLLVVDVDDRQLILDTAHGVPVIAHFGESLGLTAAADLAATGTRPIPKGALDSEAPASICPEQGSGWQGLPGITGQRPDGSGWAPRFRPHNIEVSAERACITACDHEADLELTTVLCVLPASVRIHVQLHNLGRSSYHLDSVMLTLPVPGDVGEIERMTGRWSHEFQRRRSEIPDGALRFDNRRGRTSADRVPAIFAGTPGFSENSGRVWGAVLGWSGNANVSVERLTDGRCVIQMGELLASGDVCLAPGESYTSPELEIAYSADGLNGVSQALHRSIRSGPVHPGTEVPRPVVLNTWEAVYFDHDLTVLSALADAASDVGVERFVLDDGWFHGRRSDNAGLGDWWVDPAVWPDGLQPLISHVRSLGMEFGIWVEPEMVNPDSDLYRSHPDWALQAEGYESVLGRNQLVLDLGRPEVFQYLFSHLDALLRDHDVSYVKWDMNRDLVAASCDGRASMHAHMHGVYRLIDALRAEHPRIEIESCSSGGSRADFEILKRTERIWASDSNDALERQRIQDGFSLLFPPEVMGAHVGPPASHTSGRQGSLDFRCATAFMGHFGIEWNLLDASPQDRSRLASVVALHKEHRELLHGGTVWRLDVDRSREIAHLVAAPDRSEAMLSYAQLTLSRGSVPPIVRLFGLNPDVRYRFEALPLPNVPEGPAVTQPGWLVEGGEASGRVLMNYGLQLPLLHPESALVVHLREH